MQNMESEFVDLTVTSPPYDNLREYNGYEFPFEEIADQLYRITKPGGVVVWIVGDASINGSETGTSFRQALYFKEIGFNIHDTMIYAKAPSFPPNEKSIRYGQEFEYMFVFSKGKPKTVNLIVDRKNRWGGHKSFGKQTERTKKGELKPRKKNTIREVSPRWNIWHYAVGAGNGTEDEIVKDHPATFPEKLVGDHIKSWSNPNDIVYDPFMGSGTTAKIAHIMDRAWIGSEISEEYYNLSYKRLEKYLTQHTISFDG